MPDIYPAHFIDNVVVVSVSGRLMIGSGAEKLRRTFTSYLADGRKRFVVDLEGVTLADSSGSAELVSTYTTVTSRGGILVLARLPQKLADLLRVTQLITVFDVYDDIESAVETAKLSPLPDFSEKPMTG